MNRSARIGLGLVGGLLAIQAWGAEQKLLEDEPSRSELARYAMFSEGTRAFPQKFEFPKHAVKGKIFGIDVSHHQGKISWDKVADQGVRFAYVKATQGSSFYDGQFANNWTALKALGDGKQAVFRGAYHFMSSVDAPETQAANYLKRVGEWSERDLPPCLDVEWDFLRERGKFVKDEKGRNIDLWGKLDSREIVARIKIWLTKVEAATHKKPVIYTNATWWKERIGDNVELAGYKLWIADYGSRSLNKEQPRMPKNFTWSLWQLTDQGFAVNAGLTKGLDTNVLAQEDKELGALFAQRSSLMGGTPKP